jgi:hypothetical protein
MARSSPKIKPRRKPSESEKSLIVRLGGTKITLGLTVSLNPKTRRSLDRSGKRAWRRSPSQADDGPRKWRMNDSSSHNSRSYIEPKRPWTMP